MTEINDMEYNNALQLLKQTDHIALKLSEGINPRGYSDELFKRLEWRNTVNDWNGEEFVEPTLETLKQRKHDEISLAHRLHVAGSVPVSLGFPMQFGVTDCLLVEGAIRIAEMTGQGSIYLTDAEDVSHFGVSVEEAQQVLFEMSAALADAHAKKQELRLDVEAASTPEEVADIEWD